MPQNPLLTSLYSTLSISKPVDAYNTQTTDTAEKAACPLFIKSTEGYENASKKLMIFGQETNGWLSPYSSSISVEEMAK
jgi:hypothetical protein